MTAGVGHQKDGGGTAVIFVDGPEPESINWTLLFEAGVDLCDFVVGAEVEDAHVPISVATGSHGVFLVELGDHQLVLLGYDCFHENLVLERNLLDDSGWKEAYLWKDFVDLFCI
jgi:hypothetical protein